MGGRFQDKSGNAYPVTLDKSLIEYLRDQATPIKTEPVKQLTDTGESAAKRQHNVVGRAHLGAGTSAESDNCDVTLERGGTVEEV